MCFSASASFTAASLAATAGAVTLSRARSVRALPLAGIPLIFGIQQAIEGGLWLELSDHGQTALALYLADSFAAIALILWPVYAPVAAALVEPAAVRRRLILLLVPLGTAFALYSAVDIAAHPYHALVAGRSLCYINDSPYPPYALAGYATTTCAGYLLSSYPALRIFGVIVFAGLAATLIVFVVNLVSVWCFFAGLASFCLLFHFLHAPQPARLSG